jgi:hypothetical protein
MDFLHIYITKYWVLLIAVTISRLKNHNGDSGGDCWSDRVCGNRQETPGMDMPTGAEY